MTFSKTGAEKTTLFSQVHANQYPSRSFPLPLHLHSSHLAKMWQHFIINVIAVMVITSMGRLPVLYIPKNMLLSLFSPLRNNNSRNTVGQNQEFWMNEMVKQHFKELCSRGWFFSSRRNEWYTQEWCILYKFFKSIHANICQLTFK